MPANEAIGERAAPDSALLIVDVQNDFCPGGALEVTEGDRVVAVMNQAIQEFRARQRPIFATRDWHPAFSHHFAAYGGPWPKHCIQDTPGAEFHPDLLLPQDAVIITKGDNPDDSGYSGFSGHDAAGRSLKQLLEEKGVHRLVVGGLATDYCVKASVLDARHNGFEVSVVRDGVRGVEIHPGDSANALSEMSAAGAELV